MPHNPKLKTRWTDTWTREEEDHQEAPPTSHTTLDSHQGDPLQHPSFAPLRQAPIQPHQSMSNTPHEQAVRIRIWQENLNKSDTAQHCILSGPFTAKAST